MKNRLKLSKAIKEGKVDQFVQEHEDDALGDDAKFETILRSMTDKSKPTRQTSNQDAFEHCSDTQIRQDTSEGADD